MSGELRVSVCSFDEEEPRGRNVKGTVSRLSKEMERVVRRGADAIKSLRRSRA